VTIYVALLRGINVGGRNRVKMADLRRICEDLGHRQVETYVQSGNVVFASDRSDADAIGAALADRISAVLGVSPACMVRSLDELGAVVAGNPFVDEVASDPTKVHCAFLSEEPADPSPFTFDMHPYAPERLVPGSGVLYLHLPGGIGRSRLAARLTSRSTEIEITIRNWRTVAALLETAQAKAST
jgi:uncharacterized protein (DUF1697 family)